MKRLQILLFPAVFLFFSGGYIFSTGLPWVEVQGGVLWIGNGEKEGAVSPVSNTLGVSLPLLSRKHFFLAQGLTFTGTQYQLSFDGGKAIPTEIEYADGVWVLSAILDLKAGFNFNFSSVLSGGFSFIPAGVFRFPLMGWGAFSEDTSLKRVLGSYFYSAGRFFYPGTEIFFHWKMNTRIGLSLRIKGYLPIFHGWDGETVPFYDQLIISSSVGLRFYPGTY